MAVFAVEAVGLMAMSPDYILSFFHIVDILCMLSVIFDVSYLFGADVTLAQTAALARTSLRDYAVMLVKATARAGRLAKLLRILRLTSCDERVLGPDILGAQGTPSAVAMQLSSSLAARVAGMAMILVIVIPLLDCYYAQRDHAIGIWIDRISTRVREQSMGKAVEEIDRMTDYFAHHSLGPYSVCKGYADGLSFICQEPIDGWSRRFNEPTRGASARILWSDTLMVAFNMHTPVSINAALSLLGVLLTACAVVISDLSMVRTVVQVTTMPLIRLFDAIAPMATSMFSAEELENADEDEEFDPTDFSTAFEATALARVRDKLGLLVQLHMGTEPGITEDLQLEDEGILEMLGDTDAGRLQKSSSVKVRRKRSEKDQSLVSRGDDGQKLADECRSWGFNPQAWSSSRRESVAAFIISSTGAFMDVISDREVLQRFITAVQAAYHPLPYHSFAHALDCTNATVRAMHAMESDSFLSKLQQVTMLVSAIAHDIGHPGLNNAFLIETSHEFALQYNDHSPLEMMHCAKLFSILAGADTQLFASLPSDDYKGARTHAIDAILSTDTAKAPKLITDLRELYGRNMGVFGRSSGLPLSEEEKNVFNEASVKSLIMNTILPSADMSSSCRTWDVTKAWAMQYCEELFQQGDREQTLGIPVQVLNDRSSSRAQAQIGLIDCLVAPLYTAQIRLWPGLHEFGENLACNVSAWERTWKQEASPAKCMYEKVHSRVKSIKTELEEAKYRS